MKQIETTFKGEIKQSLLHSWPKGYWQPIVNQPYKLKGRTINRKKDFDARFKINSLYEFAMEFKVHRDIGRAFSLSRIPRHQIEGLRKACDAGMLPMVMINVRLRREGFVAVYHPAHILKMQRQGVKSIRFADLYKQKQKLYGSRIERKKIYGFGGFLSSYVTECKRRGDW